MKRPTLIFVGALAVAAGPVAAYFLMSDPHVPRDQRNLFRVTQDLAAQLSWSTQTLVPDQDQVRHMVDWVMQQWSRNGRASYSTVLDSDWWWNIATAPPGPSVNANCKNDILWKNYEVYPGTPAYAKCTGPTANCNRVECDVTLYRVPSCFTCSNRWGSLETDPLQVGGASINPTGTLGSFTHLLFTRVLAHEIGHTLGLAHSDNNQGGSPCAAGSPVGRPLMCASNNAEFDLPSPDDLDGVRDPSLYGGVVTRQVRLVQATVSAVGDLVASEVPNQTGFSVSSIVAPRVACRRGLGAPDCVVGYTNSTGCVGTPFCVKFTTFLLNGSGYFNSVTTTLPTSKTYGEVDVAMGPDGTVVAAWMEATDHRVYVFAKPPSGSGTLSQISAQDFVQGTRLAPRLSWHASINGGLGGYVLVLVTPDHKFRVSTSFPAGTNWSTAEELFVNGGVRVTNKSQYDLVCPTHHSSAASSTCRLVFNNNTDLFPPSPAFAADNLYTRSTLCAFDVSGVNVLGAAACTVTGFWDPAQFSIGDYGNNPPQGAFAQNAWLSSVGASAPNSAINTSLIFDSAGTFQGSQTLDVERFNIPIGPGAPVKSDWGGISCDYAEYPRRFLCAQLKESSQF